MGSGTGSTQGLQVLVAYLEGKGVEVDQLKRALEDGDSASVDAWFETSYRRHVAKILEDIRKKPDLRTTICFAGEGAEVSVYGRKSQLS